MTALRQPFYRILLSATGVTIVVQLLALLRQSLTVSYFGLTRDLDLFWTVYAMAAVSVFGLNVVVESTYTALATKIRESEGDAAFRQSLRPFALASIGIGIAAAAAFICLVPPLGFLFGAGFSAGERDRLFSLALWFLPWIAAIIVYYATAALLRTAWSYRWTFFGEALVMVVSIAALAGWHDEIATLPIAYALGYLAATLWLLVRLVGISESGYGKPVPWREIGRRTAMHYSALQFTTVNALAERFWMSFVPAGGIAAMGIVQQLMMGIGGLLSFRDAYLTPLALEAGRAERLRRLMLGMFLLSAASAAFVAAMAPEAVGMLFHYGKTTSGDAALIALLLTIAAATLVSGSVGSLIWRVLQMTGRHKTFVRAFAVNAVLTFVLGWLLVGRLGLGIAGIAVASVVTSFLALAFSLFGVRTLGCRLLPEDWRLVVVVALVLPLLAECSAVLGRTAPNPLAALALAGGSYLVLIAAFAYPVRERLLRIVKGGA